MKNIQIILVICALTAASLACTMNIGGPATPDRTIAVSTEAVGNLETQVQQALQSSQDGQVTFVITEEQLTSLLAEKLQSNPDALITDPQVYLSDGTIQIFGKAKKGMYDRYRSNCQRRRKRPTRNRDYLCRLWSHSCAR
jgi:hypothetical protein